MSQSTDEAVKPRILLIDDSKVMRKAAVKMLGDLYDVVVAEDGEEGWGIILNDSSIQVAFTDLKMSTLDGFGLIERVQNLGDSLLNRIEFRGQFT